MRQQMRGNPLKDAWGDRYAVMCGSVHDIRLLPKKLRFLRADILSDFRPRDQRNASDCMT